MSITKIVGNYNLQELAFAQKVYNKGRALFNTYAPTEQVKDKEFKDLSDDAKRLMFDLSRWILAQQDIKRDKGSLCEKMYVPESVCRLVFNETEDIVRSGECGQTIRGENMIVDLDENGKVLAIELEGLGKKCQEVSKNGKNN